MEELCDQAFSLGTEPKKCGTIPGVDHRSGQVDYLMALPTFPTD